MLQKNNIALFVTCLVDFFRPEVAFATIKLLEEAGCKVSVPIAQTCCGQPAYNNGDRKSAMKIATQVIDYLETFDYVVIPSGSCAGMIKKHYPDLFKSDKKMLARAENLAQKTHELTLFLTEILHMKMEGTYAKRVTYHDSCSSLRELNINQQPRQLIAAKKDITLCELKDSQTCCGFGGTFCVKYADIANKMVTDKVDAILQSNAEVLLGNDLGCLLHIAGKLKRMNAKVDVFHIAEVLANRADVPGIADSRDKGKTDAIK